MKKAPILLLLALLAFGPMAWAQFSGGTGTADDPYLISSKADWNALHNQVKDGNLYTGKFFKMTADIGTVTTPIGYTNEFDNRRGNYFEGTFDGNGHILTGADIDLLQTPSYTFEAKADDSASRFKLVFATGDGN